MGILSNIFKRSKPTPQIEERNAVHGLGLTFGFSSSYTSEQALKLSAVYCAVEMISNAVAQLPLEPYKVDKNGFRSKNLRHPLYHILSCEPNERMTRFQFIKIMVTNMLLKGNAYAYIQRNDNGSVKGLIYIPSELVTIVPPTNLIDPVTYRVTGLQGEIKHTDMIHIVNFSYDGIVGVSTLSHARRTLNIAFNAETSAESFFENGCNLSGILTVEGNLTPKQKADIDATWKQTHNSTSGNMNGIAILEGNMKYQPTTINPTDAQLLSSREFDIIQIARFFQISPTKLMDYTKSNYNTLEATNLSFLTDTIQPILAKFEAEFERKLCPTNQHNSFDIKFDVAQLLRADKKSLAEYFSKLFQIGAISIDEIRRELDLPAIENGDNHFVQVNLQTLERAVSSNPATSQDIKEAINVTETEDKEKETEDEETPDTQDK